MDRGELTYLSPTSKVYAADGFCGIANECLYTVMLKHASGEL